MILFWDESPSALAALWRIASREGVRHDCAAAGADNSVIFININNTLNGEVPNRYIAQNNKKRNTENSKNKPLTTIQLYRS